MPYPVTLRSEKGARLTHEEMDNNFRELLSVIPKWDAERQYVALEITSWQGKLYLSLGTSIDSQPNTSPAQWRDLSLPGPIVSYTYANDSARTSATGFTANDVNKLARTNSNPIKFHVLTNHDPTTWVELGGGGGGGSGGNAVSYFFSTYTERNAEPVTESDIGKMCVVTEYGPEFHVLTAVTPSVDWTFIGPANIPNQTMINPNVAENASLLSETYETLIGTNRPTIAVYNGSETTEVAFGNAINAPLNNGNSGIQLYRTAGVGEINISATRRHWTIQSNGPTMAAPNLFLSGLTRAFPAISPSGTHIFEIGVELHYGIGAALFVHTSTSEGRGIGIIWNDTVKAYEYRHFVLSTTKQLTLQTHPGAQAFIGSQPFIVPATGLHRFQIVYNYTTPDIRLRALPLSDEVMTSFVPLDFGIESINAPYVAAQDVTRFGFGIVHNANTRSCATMYHEVFPQL